MNQIVWTNEKRRVKDLIPWEKNPRKISDSQLETLKTSITKFNYAAPILVDINGKIVAGHMRVRALMALGRGDEEVDVRVGSRPLTEEEFRELAIRDNQNGGEWDWAALKELDREFLQNIGFEEAELLKNMGLDDAGKQTVEAERLEVLAVNPPEAARLKERGAFHFETMEDYKEVCEFFGSGPVLDHKKILELVRGAK